MYRLRHHCTVGNVRLAALVLLAFAPLQRATAAESAGTTAPRIPGFERFYADGTEDQVAAGELLLTELNCVSCHRATSTEAATKQAPILSRVSGRVRADYLRRFLADPHAVKPGTTMPQMFARVSPEQRDEQIEALVHYLVSLGPGEPVQEFPILGSSSVGERLYHQVGCVACHGARAPAKNGDAESGSEDALATSLSTSVPLGDLLAKYTLPSLTDFLRDPLHVRPSGRMPSLNLAAGEARAIASFLLKGLPEVANIEYRYYEGNWQEIPDFTSLEPKEQGGTSTMDVSLRKRNDQFGLRFDGFVRIDKQGEYTFHLGSDDGSRLWVDGEPVIVNGGIHPYGVKSQKLQLAEGVHAISVDYFEQGGEERLTVEWEGPGIARQPLASAMSAVKAPPQKESLAIQLDPERAAAGRELFVTLGCSSCHEVREGEQRLPARKAAASLALLPDGGGCLADQPLAQLPDYNLSRPQRDALQAALAAHGHSASGPAEASPEQSIHQTLIRFNCLACHQRDKLGGVESERNEWFQTTTQEMGDEGRIPPLLDGVGAKLTPYWMKKTFAEGGKDRPYMLTRMPKFGLDNVGHLVPLLDQVDQVEPVPELSFDEPMEQVKDHGRLMIGSRGFSCIKCHTFGRFQATGIQSIDMKTMTRRLQRDWFIRYVKDPQKFRPGTRMPSAWPVEQSLLPVLDADNQKQIAAVWHYLSDGPRAKIPEGLVMPSMELIPVDEAILYRNFIEGAGPRAIGVGNPEHIHYAYDAQQGRMALLWQGKYIDASRHWSGRGQGFEPPAGDSVLPLPGGPEFARLADPATTWPDAPNPNAAQNADNAEGFEFLGYRLVEDQRPVFRYRVGSLTIEDFSDTRPNEGDEGLLLRTFTFDAGATTPATEDVYFRAARDGNIEARADGWYRIGDQWEVQIQGAKARVRDAGGQKELLVPLDTSDGKDQFTVRYRW